MKANKLNTGKNHSLPHFTKELGALKDLNKTKDLNMSKEEQDSADLLSNICNFNSLVGKGILLCLQKQANLAQTLFDVLQDCGISKDKLRMSGQDKLLRPNKGSFSGVVSPRHESATSTTGLSKLQGFIDEMGLLLGNFGHEKEEKKIKPLEIEISLLASPSEHLNKSKDSQRSPKPSFSHRGNDVKRSSMPLVNISSTGENYSMTTRRKAESSLNFVNDQRILTENMQIINTNRAIQSQSQPQNKIFAKKTQANKPAEVKNKSQALKLNLKNITTQTFADSKNKVTSATVKSNNNKEATDFFYPPHIIKELNQQRAKENNNPHNNQLKSMRSTARDYSSFDMISPKPTTSTIPKKELFDESVLEHQDERDESFDSSENLVSTPAIDTDRMFRTLDAHENSLLQSLNNLKTSTIPLKEKRTLKKLLQEEYGAKGNDFPRSDLGQLYEKKYIISAKWWRSWKEYVNFDSLDDSTSMINVEAYPRPGRLVNRGLIRYDVIDDLDLLPGTLELKDHLLEHHDYEAVSRKVFDLLCKWYGCDFEIARCLKSDPFRNNKLYLDLYPEYIEKTVRSTRLKSLSPRVDFKVENVISNIINTNLSDYQKKK